VNCGVHLDDAPTAFHLLLCANNTLSEGGFLQRLIEIDGFVQSSGARIAHCVNPVTRFHEGVVAKGDCWEVRLTVYFKNCNIFSGIGFPNLAQVHTDPPDRYIASGRNVTQNTVKGDFHIIQFKTLRQYVKERAV